MLGIHDLWLFVGAGLLLNITPGPDTAYIVGRSLQMGWRGGMAAALGIGAGCFVHVFGAAIGLSTLLAASATAFMLVKLVGAAYLIVIGVRMLLSRSTAEASPGAASGVTLRQVLWQGAMTNALNPKVALFFLAFLPQFVDADAPNQALAFLTLGAIFVLNGTLWCLGIAAVSARAASRWRGGRRLSLGLNRILGGLLVFLGVRLVTITQH